MEDIHLLVQLAVALGAALAGGLLARLLRLPPLVGFLVAGVAIGPYTPGWFADAHAVEGVARIGVALLMFAVGVQFSLEELLSVRRVALLGGALQITGSVGLGVFVGMALGWGLYGGVFLGCAISLSSTAVMMRILEERGDLGTSHGRAMLGILVVQDLTLVVMAMLLPVLATLSSGGAAALLDVAGSLLRAILFLAVALAAARMVVPLLLHQVARVGSQELFLLSVVCICLAAAYLTFLAGFSLEIGAFLAGLIVTESDYAQEVFAQIRPLRDVFASLFFVSVGMLVNPAFLLERWAAVLVVALAIIFGKGLIASLAVYTAGQHGRTALLAGFGLAQIGEFSFVLAALGQERELIGPEISSTILTAAMITLLLAAPVYSAGGSIYALLNQWPPLSSFLNRESGAGSKAPASAFEPRVIILGGGRVGGFVSDALRSNHVPHVVVDYDVDTRSRLRAEGVAVVYGDAASEAVLRKALAPSIELAVVALPEGNITRLVMRELRRMAPSAQLVVRVHRGFDVERAYAAGADAVIHAEFEAATAMIRQGLLALDFGAAYVEEYIEGVRRERLYPGTE